jgi:hypothetical protein
MRCDLILGTKKEIAECKKNSKKRVVTALADFLEPLLENCENFVFNQRTFGNESFHSLCNRYYEKGSVVSFEVFKMKRQFAALDWNEQILKKTLGEVDLDIQDWQTELLDRLSDALRA